MAFKEQKNEDVKYDGWANEITGLGIVGTDKRMGMSAYAPVLLSQERLENIYQDDHLARKIVLKPAKEMTREGIDITPSEKMTSEIIDKINKDIKKLKLWKNIRKAIQWSRLHGGGVVVMIIEDGGDANEPVDINRIKRISGLYDLNRYQIYPYSYQNDPSKSGFLEPETFMMTTTSIGPQSIIASMEKPSAIATEWHRSRLMIFDGIDLPEHPRQRNNGWGDSILQAIYNELRNYHQGQDSAASLVSDFSQAVFKIKSLHNKVAAGGGNVVSSRLALINLARSLINAVIIDADGEEFTRQSTPVTGLPDLLDRFERGVVSASEMPHTVLFGDSPSGLGATGNHEEKIWKDSLKSDQVEKIGPELEMFLAYYSASTESGLKGIEIPYEFGSLYQQDQKEQAEIREKIAKADAANIQWGVYSSDEARSRYEGDTFSVDLSLEEKPVSELEQEEEPPEGEEEEE